MRHVKVGEDGFAANVLAEGSRVLAGFSGFEASISRR
jgi:hypothetical protein